MSWLKIITGSLTAIATTVGVARGIAKKRVETTTEKIIADASSVARDRVKEGASFYLSEAWRSFWVVTLIKVAVLTLLFAASYFQLAGPKLLAPAALIFLITSITYDIYSRRALIRDIVRWVRMHGLRPRKIIRLTVANQVFEEVLLEYKSQKASLVRTALIHFGGHKPDALGEKVAAAVSDTASSAAWDDMKPFVKTAAIRIVLLFSAYCVFATYILWQISKLT